MLVMGVHELAVTMGTERIDDYFTVLDSTKTVCYRIPNTVRDQTVLAKSLSEVFLRSETWLHITYWNNDVDSNQNLFYGYRRGHGDGRSLTDAPVYKFNMGETSELSSILSMILYFSWDARVFDLSRSYLVTISNEGFFDSKTSSDMFSEELEREMSLLGLKPLA